MTEAAGGAMPPVRSAAAGPRPDRAPPRTLLCLFALALGSLLSAWLVVAVWFGAASAGAAETAGTTDLAGTAAVDPAEQPVPSGPPPSAGALEALLPQPTPVVDDDEVTARLRPFGPPPHPGAPLDGGPAAHAGRSGDAGSPLHAGMANAVGSPAAAGPPPGAGPPGHVDRPGDIRIPPMDGTGLPTGIGSPSKAGAAPDLDPPPDAGPPLDAGPPPHAGPPAHESGPQPVVVTPAQQPDSVVTPVRPLPAGPPPHAGPPTDEVPPPTVVRLPAPPRVADAPPVHDALPLSSSEPRVHRPAAFPGGPVPYDETGAPTVTVPDTAPDPTTDITEPRVLTTVAPTTAAPVESADVAVGPEADPLPQSAPMPSATRLGAVGVPASYPAAHTSQLGWSQDGGDRRLPQPSSPMTLAAPGASSGASSTGGAGSAPAVPCAVLGSNGGIPGQDPPVVPGRDVRCHLLSRADEPTTSPG